VKRRGKGGTMGGDYEYYNNLKRSNKTGEEEGEGWDHGRGL